MATFRVHAGPDEGKSWYIYGLCMEIRIGTIVSFSEDKNYTIVAIRRYFGVGPMGPGDDPWVQETMEPK